ncbi:sigma-54 dependent transcriptional regulator [uncultured Desulfosarcina sp.]|uniref:sigma-54-dependent transcriptional regulator n=1 Tax=uncultured Desulfosarcina sp. TaxID=218289 RepID=UPI0029C7152A|nr:sigma-54 dependent transcriptional regulator [uncultured Desulfosarcina sp.]
MATQSEQRHLILAVDDNRNALEIIRRILAQSGYEVLICEGVPDAVNLLNDQRVDLVITDMKMPKHSGFELVRHVSENFQDTAVIMVTGYPSIEGAVEAIKIGADDFLAKPYTDDELISVVRRALDRLTAQRAAQSVLEWDASFGIVGNSEPMKKVFKLIAKAATMTANVLISGESGTGKELVARAIHYNSPRSSAAFVPVNCTAIPESLVESELFGHEKGAFTGANANRSGFFEVADGGTLFLDEIGDASQSLQAKLLRVLQNKEIIKVGSSQIIKVDARIVAATNKDLPDLIHRKLFREDLYYRIDVIDIAIPPLRERREDVPLLIRHFTAQLCEEMGRDPLFFSDRAMNAMAAYSWPGNVRELENLVQKLIVTVDGNRVDMVDLPGTMRFSIEHQAGLNRPLAAVEHEYIQNVLASVGGNKTQAAKILKIDRKTLREKLKKIASNPN